MECSEKPVYIPQSKLAQYREDNAAAWCPILGHSPWDPVVDHCHKTGMIRGVISRQSNSLLGKAENFYNRRCGCSEVSLPEVLRNLAAYLEKHRTCDRQMDLHPVGLRQLAGRFSRLPVPEQIEKLKELKATPERIQACKNSMARKILYRERMKDLA